MISDSMIIFGATGNVVMVLNGELPKDSPIHFRIGANNAIDLLTDDTLIYSEQGLSVQACQKLKQASEIGLMEVMDTTKPPKHLTNVAYRYSA
jgi:hypothetical protein